MKKSVVLSVVISLTILSNAFAASITEHGNKKGAIILSKAAKKVSNLLEAEAKFYSELDSYYYETFEKPADELIDGINESENKKIVVYNLEGDIITTDESKMPANAEFLMSEGETLYYIVD